MGVLSPVPALVVIEAGMLLITPGRVRVEHRMTVACRQALPQEYDCPGAQTSGDTREQLGVALFWFAQRFVESWLPAVAFAPTAT